MGRTTFSSAEANIVVSTDGYFDVYPPIARSNGDHPAYRGLLAELGAGIRGIDDRLAVRPGSVALAKAVSAWSTAHGAAAVRGEIGRGRDGKEVKIKDAPTKEAKTKEAPTKEAPTKEAKTKEAKK